jgi:hypothetical protein
MPPNRNIAELVARLGALPPGADAVPDVNSLIMMLNVERNSLSDGEVVDHVGVVRDALLRGGGPGALAAGTPLRAEITPKVELLASRRRMLPVKLLDVLFGGASGGDVVLLSAASPVAAAPAASAAVPSVDLVTALLSKVSLAPPVPATAAATGLVPPATAPLTAPPSTAPTPAAVAPPPSPALAPVHPLVIDAFTRSLAALHASHRVQPAQVRAAEALTADLQRLVRHVLVGSEADTMAVDPVVTPVGGGGGAAGRPGAPASAPARGGGPGVVRNDPGAPLARSAPVGASPLPQQQQKQQQQPPPLPAGTRVPSPRLHIFGSLVNGFGTAGSDVDLSIELHPGCTPGLLRGNLSDAFHDLRRQLPRRGYSVFQYIQPGRSAVPLLRVTATGRVGAGTKVDLGFANVLGVHNSRLLATYAALDDRVAPLGVGLKLWARSRSINEASAHFLSSYAYIMAAVFFLQQPGTGPVLPVLQDPALVGEYEAATGTAVPHVAVDGKHAVRFVSDVPWLRAHMARKRAAAGAQPVAAAAAAAHADGPLPPEGVHADVVRYIPGLPHDADAATAHRTPLGALFLGLLRWLLAFDDTLKAGVLSTRTGRLLPREIWLTQLGPRPPRPGRRRKGAAAAAAVATPAGSVVNVAGTPATPAAPTPATDDGGGDEAEDDGEADEGDDDEGGGEEGDAGAGSKEAGDAGTSTKPQGRLPPPWRLSIEGACVGAVRGADAAARADPRRRLRQPHDRSPTPPPPLHPLPPRSHPRRAADPFDLSHDLGRPLRPFGYFAITMELRRACGMAARLSAEAPAALTAAHAAVVAAAARGPTTAQRLAAAAAAGAPPQQQQQPSPEAAAHVSAVASLAERAGHLWASITSADMAQVEAAFAKGGWARWCEEHGVAEGDKEDA